MQFKIVDKIDDEKIENLITDNPELLGKYFNLSKNKNTIIQRKVKEFYNTPEQITRYFVYDNEIRGFYTLNKSDWDSVIFNRSMWKMNFFVKNQILHKIDDIKAVFYDDCNINDIEHISCQIHSNDYINSNVLEELNFRVMDSIIRFGMKLPNPVRSIELREKDEIIIREYTESDYSNALKLIDKVFNNYPNRFLNDLNFDGKECKRMFVEWAKNSMNGFADTIVVSESADILNGFSTVKHKKPLGTEGIIIAEGQLSGVLDSYRGKGINVNMLQKRLDIASNNCDYYEVGTQIYNYASQRTFYRCGLKPIDSYFTFHLSV